MDCRLSRHNATDGYHPKDQNLPRLSSLFHNKLVFSVFGLCLSTAECPIVYGFGHMMHMLTNCSRFFCCQLPVVQSRQSQMSENFRRWTLESCQRDVADILNVLHPFLGRVETAGRQVSELAEELSRGFELT